MIDLKEVEHIHDILIEKFGGTKGIRDKGSLESAIARPYQTFDGKELYPHPEDKAAAIFEALFRTTDPNKSHKFLVGYPSLF